MSTAHFTGTSGTPDSTTSYYMGGQFEVKDGATKKYYSLAGMMVAVNDGTGLQYLLTDHLGSTVAVTNQSGTLTSQQRYLPFGAARTIPNSPILGTDFTYTGQRKLDDGMGGIMDYKARFYSPALMRFLQPDTIIPDQTNPQSWNRFSYVRNNPILFNDPSGHKELCDEMLDCRYVPTPPPGGGGGGGDSGGNSGDEDHPRNDDDIINDDSYHITIPSYDQYPDWTEYQLSNGGTGYLGCFEHASCSSRHFFQLNHHQQGDLVVFGYDYYHKPGSSFLSILGDGLLALAEANKKIPSGAGFVVGAGADLIRDAGDRHSYNSFRPLLELFTQTDDGNSPMLITINQNVHQVMGDCRNEMCAPVSSVNISIEGTSISYVQSTENTDLLITLLNSLVVGEP